MLENLLNSSLLISLSLTLCHFIWQGSLIALALKSALVNTSTQKSQLRYLLSSFAMLSVFIAPIITFFNIYFSPSSTAIAKENLNNNSLTVEPDQLGTIWLNQLYDLFPLVSIAWLTVACLLASKVILELQNVHKLTNDKTIPPDEKLKQKFDQLVMQLGLHTSPKLLLSLKINTPMAIGWIKPVVLIPASMVSGLAPSQLEMLILHELAHIRRHDYLVNFLQTMIEILFFFHPAVHWISKQMRNEREYCSDDIAVHHCGDPIAYAHTLADTATICNKHRHTSIPSMAMAASGGDLKQRVVRLVKEHHCTSNNQSGKFIAAFIILIILCLCLLGQLSITALSSVKNLNVQQEHLSSNIKNNNLVDPNLLIKNYFKLSAGFRVTTPFSAGGSPIEISRIENQPVGVNDKSHDKSTNVVEEASRQAPKINNKTNENSNKSIIVNREKVQTSNDSSQRPLNSTQDQVAKKTNSFSITKVNNSHLVIETKNKVQNNLAKTKKQNKTQLKKGTSLDPLSESSAINSNDNVIFTAETNLIKENSSGLDSEKNEKLIAYKQHSFDVDANKDRSAPLSAHSEKEASTTGITTAKLLNSAEPDYPDTAKRQSIELDLLVEFEIDSEGRVSDIQIEKKHKSKYFRSAIKNAVSKWRFIPAHENGKAIGSKMSKIFSFNLA